MSKSAKMAVSMPGDTYAGLEAARKKAGLGRSAAVAQAVDAWVAEQREPRGPDQRYVEGYLRRPEDASALAAIAAGAVATLGEWSDDK